MHSGFLGAGKYVKNSQIAILAKAFAYSFLLTKNTNFFK